MAANYSKAIPSGNITVETDVKVTLQKITPALFLAFEARYAGKYKSAYMQDLCVCMLTIIHIVCVCTCSTHMHIPRLWQRPRV